MELRNESVGGGYGYGGGFCGDGILGMIALLSVFRGNLWGGNYEGAGANLAEVQNQLANIRADIGQAKYDAINSTLQQTIGLMGEINAGRFEHLNAIFNQTMHLESEFKSVNAHICAVEKDVLINRYELGKEIQRMGYENQLANCQQTNVLSRQIADCCCETNGNIRETAFQTQLRDLEYKGDTDKQLAEIKCLIKDTAKDQEIARLSRMENQLYIANQINRGINATVGHWSADAQFNGVTYPQPPFPGAWGY